MEKRDSREIKEWPIFPRKIWSIESLNKNKMGWKCDSSKSSCAVFSIRIVTILY